MDKLRRILLLATLTGMGLASFESPLHAESWPLRAVRIIMPQPAGTGSDLTVRLFAERLATRWGKPVVVENRPGGDGTVGVSAFAAVRDDHTLLFSVSAPFALQPLIQEALPYDPERDAVPIAMASDITLVVAVSDGVPVTSLGDLITYVRSHPGQLNWTAGPGLPRYVFAAFSKRLNLDLTYISYRELAPAIQDLMSGRLHVIIHGLSVVRAPIEAGKVRLLAVTNQQRAAAAGETPTVTEAGFPDLAMDGLSGFFGPRDLSEALRGRLAKDISAVAMDPTIATRLTAAGQSLRTSTPQEFSDVLAAQRRRMEEIVRIVGKKPG
ncbi:Bug family tripartite tricarboxylate transporter substrate binding protein [Bradyrhizobium murdochi]|uniref:Bug family tripartite tricarboxylate transporter substrate binding protein n=1 Tax=Bradyrhizobium murdochi TaxID=1038859 RepID=UPI000A06C9EF|nr:tripartite tricarboxylate transporter substrate binding protein [Bradyrhizobium murdochi]